MNTIVLLLDSLRRDHLGCYGNPWIKTPNIDALAARSAVFENAFCGSYPCMPARRDIWTGRYEFLWRGWGPLEAGDDDFPARLKASGAVSMLISDHYHLWSPSMNYHRGFSGFDWIRGNEFDPFVTDAGVAVELPAAPEKLAQHCAPGTIVQYFRNTAGFREEAACFAPRVMTRAMEWLERNCRHERFCLFVDCFDPHEPFDPPQPYRDMYNPDHARERIVWPTYGDCRYDAAELRDIRALYAGKVTMVDAWVGKLLDRVAELGLMESTAIILLSDHGHLLGEHNTIGKPPASVGDANLYDELARIPLIVYLPGAEPKRVEALAQPVDLFPTLLELSELPTPPGIHGGSLLPLVRGEETEPRPYAFYGRFGEAICVTDGEWSLFKWPPGDRNEPLIWHSGVQPSYGTPAQASEPLGIFQWRVPVERGTRSTALYNWKEDPWQERDASRSRPDTLRRLENALSNWLRQIGAPAEQFERLGLPAAESETREGT